MGRTNKIFKISFLPKPVSVPTMVRKTTSLLIARHSFVSLKEIPKSKFPSCLPTRPKKGPCLKTRSFALFVCLAIDKPRKTTFFSLWRIRQINFYKTVFMNASIQHPIFKNLLVSERLQIILKQLLRLQLLI